MAERALRKPKVEKEPYEPGEIKRLYLGCVGVLGGVAVIAATTFVINANDNPPCFVKDSVNIEGRGSATRILWLSDKKMGSVSVTQTLLGDFSIELSADAPEELPVLADVRDVGKVFRGEEVARLVSEKTLLSKSTATGSPDGIFMLENGIEIVVDVFPDNERYVARCEVPETSTASTRLH